MTTTTKQLILSNQQPANFPKRLEKGMRFMLTFLWRVCMCFPFRMKTFITVYSSYLVCRGSCKTEGKRDTHTQKESGIGTQTLDQISICLNAPHFAICSTLSHLCFCFFKCVFSLSPLPACVLKEQMMKPLHN